MALGEWDAAPHQLAPAGPCRGRLVQDPGSAHPGDHKSHGREEDGPGPGGLCAMFPWLLPRYHRGNKRSVGGGELVQDPTGLHGRPADQLLHLATSANRKLLLRAPEAQAGCRPVCCHRLELLPLLESKSDVRWKLRPLPASPSACCLSLPHLQSPWNRCPWLWMGLGYAGRRQQPSCSLLGGPQRLQLWPSLFQGHKEEDGVVSTPR